jgi:hypothetical protein
MAAGQLPRRDGCLPCRSLHCRLPVAHSSLS